MNKYRLVAKKGEGTFSEVLKAQCIKNGKYVAIKCMKNHFDSLDQVNNLREIQALRRLSPHPHIIKLLEVLYDQPTGRLALVFELMDMNIYELIRGRRHYVAEERVRSYMYQLMKALDHMHRNGIFHRDIKPENILIMDDVLKLADLGSCRGVYSKQPYTEYISTRWYRAPECLLTDGYYNYKMDMWGVGCVMFEIVALYPLFPGNNELDQIQKIHAIIGTPPAELLSKLKKRSSHSSTFNFPFCEGTGLSKMLSHVPPDCADLISKLLAYNPDERLSARQALRHPYFRDRHEADKRARAAMQPDLVGSSHLCAMDSECSSQQPPSLAGPAAARPTDYDELTDTPAAAGAMDDHLPHDLAAAPPPAAAGPRSTWHGAGVASSSTNAAAAGVAGVLSEHLAAVAAAAAAAVAAVATAAGKGPGGGKDAGMHGMLPAISNSSNSNNNNSSSSKSHHHHHQHLNHHAQPMQQQQSTSSLLPSQPSVQHQQHHLPGPHRPRQHPTSSPAHHQQQQQQQQGIPQHNSVHHQQHQQRQQQQAPQQQPQPPQGGGLLEGVTLQGHQLLGGPACGSNSLRDRADGSIRQLMAEASTLSQAGGQQQQQLGGLGLQGSMGSLWRESSSSGVVGLGSASSPAGGGQMLPPLVGKSANCGGGGGAGGGGAAQQSSARRSSHLDHTGASSHPHIHKPQQLQHPHPAAAAVGAFANNNSGGSSSSSSTKPLQGNLASKAGMLQQEQQLHARSNHHGMQISSARYHKQGSKKSSLLQPAGSLGSSMSNLSSMQLSGGGGVAAADSKHTSRASVGSSSGLGSMSATKAAGSLAASGGGGGAVVKKYVSPYGQRR